MARLYEEREEVIKSNVVTSVTCNNCGESKERNFEGDCVDREGGYGIGNINHFILHGAI